MLNLALVIAILVPLHVGTMAVAGHLMGVRIHWVCYGCGPALLRTRRFHLRALPIGGAVQFFHSQTDELPESDWRQLIDRRSVPAQWLVMLSGCIVLLGLAVALQGRVAVAAFLSLPAQLVAGAISPLGDAQALLGQAVNTVRASSFVVLLALAAAKVAALNLLPLPMLNGGAALAALARRMGLARHWPVAATRALSVVWLAVSLLWALALGAYLLGI